VIFYAEQQSQISNWSGPALIPSSVKHESQTGMWNPSNGEFTAPRAGVFQLLMHVAFQKAGASRQSYFEVFKNATKVSYYNGSSVVSPTNENVSITCTLVWVGLLQAGDKIKTTAWIQDQSGGAPMLDSIHLAIQSLT